MKELTDKEASIKMAECPECQSNDLAWFIHKSSKAPHGRMILHDVRIQFVLGCDECSATIEAISEDEGLKRFNAVKKFMEGEG